MGVQGLWELLSPVGRRVSVETLAGKKLAIDASIWIVQFMKAMRDEKGEMVRNAHLIGFFRRICKLMFLRAKPVFVFDGGTPALKRRTVIARRRMRENAKAKVRKTAEKLLLNHLKVMRLKELADGLENQRMKNDAKGKKIIIDETEMASNNVDENKSVRATLNQEELDAMLAASLAAEEDRSINGNASTSGAGVTVDEDEEDDDDDEEMILPAMSGKVDPAVLASLPPSMQLDLLVQMRERLMAENRQKYQKVKKAPAKFSELQIQSYLKTVAFRREIDQVQKVAAGKNMGGVQISRIASEANREFIFSSSFSGDKEALTSAGVDGHSKISSLNKPSEISSTLLDSFSSTSNSNTETEVVLDNTKKALVEEIETYKDERGRFRVSRVRAMGIRMTRDLQRNLDLIKEIEQDTMQTDEIRGIGSNLQKNVEPKDLNDELTSKNEKFMEISFEDNGGEKNLDGDDDIFARLVAGETNIISSSNSSASKGDLSFHAVNVDDESEVEWEDDILNNLKCASLSPTETGKSAVKGGEKFMKGDDDIFVHLVAGETNKKSSHDGSSKVDLPSHAGDADDESEVEWEDDDIYDPECAFLSSSVSTKIASKGVLEEEADFQEALRRSLKELGGNKFGEVPLEDKNLKEAIGMVHEGTGVGSLRENERDFENLIDVDEYPNEVLNEIERIDAGAIANKTISEDISAELPASMAGFCDKPRKLEEKHSKTYSLSDSVPLIKETSEEEILLGEPQISDIALEETSSTISVAEPNVVEAAKNDVSSGTTKQREIQVKDLTNNDVTVQEFPEQKAFDNISVQREDDIEEFPFEDNLTDSVQFTKADLEEEMQNLSQECIELGDQQRKLNRNMESVSSEMFAECQELLQMFGLPYIIAPMEAEAQCAYMELTGLVDGVVTDDSDVFLFGAKSVYKNIFDDRKYVETYFMKDIENELGLSRDKLIRMALLLGSDYTEGVSGIGIVNAIEVVNAFPEDNGFCKFREWIESPDPNILGKVGTQTVSKSKRRGSEVSDMEIIDESKRLFMNKHRNVSKNWHVPSTFPNEAVISAYTSPEVDKSTEPFSWGKPDHFVLRKLCWEKFGWNVQKADELLIPVLKEYNKRETQLRLEAFYTFNEKFAKIRSKRIQKAVKGIRGNISSEIMDGDDQEISKRRKKRKTSSAKCSENVTKKSLSGEGENENNSSEKLSNKRKHGEIVTSKEKAKNFGKRSKDGKNVKCLSGRGGRGETRNGRMKTPELDSDESSDDGNNSDFEKEMQFENEEKTFGVRKSTRSRKAVKYTLDDLESDEPGKEDQQEMSSGNPVAVAVHSSKEDSVVGNDAAAPGEKNPADVGDSSLIKFSSGNYLQIGGGFCVEEADPECEISNLSSAPIDKLLFEKELPKEDFMVGGGFCLEEDGTDDRCVYESEHKLDPSAPTAEVESFTFPVSPYQGNNGDSSTVPVKSLCAMPALKRKRRKS